MRTLHEIIHENVREGELYEKLDRNWVRCFCLRALLQYSRRPAWGLQGSLQPEWNVACALGLCRRHPMRPIEKKPFFHAHPGALAYSFGMLGCDLHCAYRQNWVSSQALRDPAAVVGPMHVTPTDPVLC
jgi:pyruvate formate lyase activating enzyme